MNKKILYISALSSEQLVNNIHKLTIQNPGFAVQKFSRLLVKGMIANGVDVIAFSSPPYGSTLRIRDFKRIGCEEENCIKYKYVPFYNIPFIKHLCVFVYTFFYVLFWGMKERNGKSIVCDVLTVSICLGGLFASKLNGLQCVAIVTDIYGLMIGEKKTAVAHMASKINNWYVSRFDKYILLTEQMNALVNPRKRPYMVMEGLCDATLNQSVTRKVDKVHPRTVIYAGGIYEKYGLKMLAEGFLKANVEDAKLVLYGSGTYVEEYKSLCSKHSNLEYGGVVPNEVIIEEEYKASLLVNPRFSTEEFTKYSFPSKNMEYMASGTPLLTTKLPGMPKEYYPYVFLFEEETVEGYARALREALSHTHEELSALGQRAQQFVLQNKNNVAQGRRILEFLNYNV